MCKAGSRGQYFDNNYCSDGERQLVIEENVSTYVPQTIQYENIIDESKLSGYIVNDGCGYT